MIKNTLAMQETQVQSLDQEDPLEKEMATHSSILALKNSMDSGAWWATVHGVARVGHDLATKPPIQTFVSKVISLLFNMLSRFVIAFLPGSKHLLIS